jgi:hypothetical protein
MAILLVNCSDICQKTSDMDPHTAHKGRGRPHTFENTASFEMEIGMSRVNKNWPRLVPVPNRGELGFKG